MRGLTLVLGLLLALPALAAPRRVEKAEVHLVADRSSYAAGDELRLAAVLDIEAGWHVNSHRPAYDYLIPTEAEFELPAGWPEAEVDYPPGEMQTFAFAEEPLSVYDGRVAVVARARVPEGAPAGRAEVVARVTYQACDDSSCLPPVTTEAMLELGVGTSGEPAHEEIFAAGSAAGAPPAEQAARPAGDERPTGDTTPAGGRSLAVILLLGLLGGLILNAMPCVLPVLSLKVFGLVRSASEGRRALVVGTLGTAAGILVSFWALAGAAVAAKAAGSAVGWGVQFQNPTFVTFLAVVVVLFCLNLWGLFEIRLPAFLARAGTAGGREGVAGHFATGLFATLMATPCSAPFLGTALGFALGQTAPVILAVFTAVGVGMALPYLLLAASPRAARFLPRPGAWMDTLKGLMGFLLAAAVIWLLYVLGAQVSPVRLAGIELGLLTLALFLWLAHRGTAGRLARRLATAGSAAAVAATLWVALGAQGEVAGSAGRAAGGAGGPIAWAPFDRHQAEALAADGRLVFVDVTADWCFTCKFNEKLVLETPEIAGAFRQHGVVAMKADWTNRDEAIADYLASFERYGIPFYALYRPGAEPHVFSELLTKGAVLSVLEEAGRERLAQRPATAARPPSPPPAAP